MKNLILSCKTLRAELDLMLHKLDCSYPVIYLESGLHNIPQNLHDEMQKTVDRLSNVDNILIIMGFCGNAILDLKASQSRIIIPKVDDCISLLLGSVERRREISSEKPTYYLSKGWIDMYDEVEKPMVGDLGALEKRYDKEKALRIFRKTYRNYKRIGLIDTGTFDMKALEKDAEKQSELTGLPVERVAGTMDYLERFLNGPWEEEYFIVLEKGQTVTLGDTMI